MIFQDELLTHVLSPVTGLDAAKELTWSYDSEDPFAITMATAPVWVFSRDLIAEGLVTPDDKSVGDGAVRISTDGEWVRFFLMGDGGPVQLRLIKQDLINFVDETIQIVGPEEEESGIAEAELDEILYEILSESEET